MTTALLEKRMRTLESEVRRLRTVVARALPHARKLPSWLAASLRDAEEGRVSGPFDTVEELMRDLEGPGE